MKLVIVTQSVSPVIRGKSDLTKGWHQVSSEPACVLAREGAEPGVARVQAVKDSSGSDSIYWGDCAIFSSSEKSREFTYGQITPLLCARPTPAPHPARQ